MRKNSSHDVYEGPKQAWQAELQLYEVRMEATSIDWGVFSCRSYKSTWAVIWTLDSLDRVSDET
jgi:hypothetical protein